jgi:hypothetical protein
MGHSVRTSNVLRFCIGAFAGALFVLPIASCYVEHKTRMYIYHEEFTSNDVLSFDTETFGAKILSLADSREIGRNEIEVVCYKGKYTIGYLIALKSTGGDAAYISEFAKRYILETNSWKHRKEIGRILMTRKGPDGTVFADRAYELPDGSIVFTPDDIRPKDVLVGGK